MSLVLLALVACTATPSTETPSAAADVAQARFADADADTLAAAARSGLGLGPLYAFLLAWEVDTDAVEHLLDDGEHCPEVALSGTATFTYTADGCRGPATGLRHEGVLVLDNVPSTMTTVAEMMSGVIPDPDAPMAVDFQDWSSDDTWIDGGFSQSSWGEYGSYDGAVDVQVGLPGSPVFGAVSTFVCTDGHCDSDATGSVDGLGGFAVDLSAVTDSYGGTLTLQGADEVRFELDGADPEGCVEAWVGDVATQVCIPELVEGDGGEQAPQPDPEEVFEGAGYGGSADELDLYAWTNGEVAAVEVDVANVGGEAEVHPLAELEAGAWSVALAEGAYAPGEGTQVRVDDDVLMRFRAYDAAGGILGCTFSATDDEAAALARFGTDGCP
jgi:hypothetical protein